MCLHTILLDPKIPSEFPSQSRLPARFAPTMAERHGSQSIAGCTRNTSRTQRGSRSLRASDCDASVAPEHIVHAKALGRNAERRRGRSWREVSGNLPSDFGFPIDVHAHEPETIYVVPIKSDSEHYPPSGRLRVYRSRTGGNDWEP
jgi:hypothetical protein